MPPLDHFIEEADQFFGVTPVGMCLVDNEAPTPRVSRLLEALILERSATRALLDRLPVGVLLVDDGARIIHMNSEAHRVLELEDGFRTDRTVLCAHHPGATADLHRLVAQATGDGKGMTGGALCLRRPSGAPALEVVVSPLRGKLSRGKTGALAVVAVSDGKGRIEGRVETAKQLYGLTPTEAAIALQLAQGLSVEESARERGICLSTVRTHVKRILDKIGVRRQSELVRILLTGPVLLARD